MKKLIKQLIWFVLVGILLTPSTSMAVCSGAPMNPVLDVAWQNIFPIKIGGVRIGTSVDSAETPDLADTPICSCPIPYPPFFRPGVSFGFWEPSRLIETVKDPFCLPTLGTQIAAPPGFNLRGASEDGVEDESSFAQAHLLIFPAWTMMEVLTDFVCVEHASFDLGYMTEVDPFWQDDSLMMLFQPEVLLFANPVAQFSCIPDAVSSQFNLPIDPLFWCAGAFGSIYPLTGHVRDGNYVQSNGLIASRLVYKLNRMLAMWDGALSICNKTPTPIWIKSHYRFQVAKPVRGIGAFGPGRSSLIWGTAKNPPFGGTSAPDNFLFVLFKKRVCCAF